MPELPEVEVTRASLATRLQGARVRGVRLGKPLRWPLGVAPDRLVGARLGAMVRRGKYLWLPFEPIEPHGPHEPPGSPATAGSTAATAAEAMSSAPSMPSQSTAPAAAASRPSEPAGGLLLHLGMSGSLSLGDPPGPAGAHDHFELDTTAGVLRLTDPRRFGAVLWSPAPDRPPAGPLLARLGAEPFDPAFTAERLHAALRGRRCTVKAALLAGDVVVGAGNIYVSEALHRAGIDPRARAGSLSRPRCARLLQALRDTLAQAIALGGSTLRDFRDAHGMAGAFQTQALVYGREGEACARCGGTVRRIVQLQRATYFCAGCQRR